MSESDALDDLVQREEPRRIRGRRRSRKMRRQIRVRPVQAHQGPNWACLHPPPPLPSVVAVRRGLATAIRSTTGRLSQCRRCRHRSKPAKGGRCHATRALPGNSCGGGGEREGAGGWGQPGGAMACATRRHRAGARESGLRGNCTMC
jgi:hypothetical protein